MENLLGIIFGVIGIIVIISLALFCRRIAPPDTALIISGFRKNIRVIIGKATFVVPFLEKVDKLSLRVMSVDVKTGDFVPSTFTFM